MRLGADVVLPWDGRDHYLAGIYRTSLADRIDGLRRRGGAQYARVGGQSSTRNGSSCPSSRR